MMKGPERVGEVVESASHRFTAQCYRLYESPPLGALVRTEAPASSNGQGPEEGPFNIYAVVSGIGTQALDPGRPVVARGEGQETEDDIYRSNPQLSRLLSTRFDALIVGHGTDPRYNQYLPASPPRIHAFVYKCGPDEVLNFTVALDFLTTLAEVPGTGGGTNDEVIAACLRQASTGLEDPHGFLVRAGKTLAVHLAGDLPRLNSILRRISP